MSKKDKDFLKTVFTANRCSTVEECVKTLELIGCHTSKDSVYTPYPPEIVRRRKLILAKMRKLQKLKS